MAFPEFMILTKKEYNDLVAERKTTALAPDNSLHPLKLGAVVARARWGLQSRARVLHTLPWALIPIRAEFPILSGRSSRFYPGCVPDFIRAIGRADLMPHVAHGPLLGLCRE